MVVEEWFGPVLCGYIKKRGKGTAIKGETGEKLNALSSRALLAIHYRGRSGPRACVHDRGKY